MKPLSIFILAFCLLSTVSYAQRRMGGPGGRGGAQQKEKIKQAKKEFLTRELALEDGQAKRFWPIYDAFDAEMEENHKKMKRIKQGFNAKSDAQLEEDIDKFFNYKEEEIAIERKYLNKFKEVLTIRQIAVLYQSEHKFKRWLLQQIQQRGGGMGGPPMDNRN